MRNRTIFLDVDGVLNSTATTNTINGYTFIDDEKVARLAELVRLTDARIVLSSDWRMIPRSEYEGIYDQDPRPCWEGLNRKLAEYGLEIADTTGDLRPQRGVEIINYVEEHPEVGDWIAIDDLGNLWPIEEHHVWTNPYHGLTDNDMKLAAIRLLDPDIDMTD